MRTRVQWLLLAALLAAPPAAAQTVNLSTTAGSCLTYSGGKLQVANVNGCSAALVGGLAPSALPAGTSTQVYGAGASDGVPVLRQFGALLDSVLGSAVGGVAVRGPTSWVNIGLGTAGYTVTSNGSGAAPSWQAVATGGLPSIASGSILGNLSGSSAVASGIPFSNFLGTTSSLAAPGDVVASHTTSIATNTAAIAALQPSLSALTDGATVAIPTTAHAFSWAPAGTTRTVSFGAFSPGDSFAIYVTPSVANVVITYPAAARFIGTATPTTPPVLSGGAGVTDLISVSIGPSGTPYVTVGDGTNTASGSPGFSGTTSQLVDGAGNPVAIGAGLALDSTGHALNTPTMANFHVLGNASGTTGPAVDANVLTLLNALSGTQGALPYRNASQWTATTCPTGQTLVSGGAGVNPICAAVGGSNGTSVTTIASCAGSQALAMPTSGAASYDITLTGTCTLTLSGGTAGQDVAVRVYARQDATAGRTLVLPSGVKWAGGAAPTPGTATGNIDVYMIRTPDAGTTYIGDY